MNTKLYATIAASALILGLAGCSSGSDGDASQKTDAPAVQETDAPAVQETTAAPEAEASNAVLETTATVEAGYPQEWVDRNIPAIDGLKVTGTYLAEYGQIRVIGDALASDDVLKAFTDELQEFGWTESVPGKEYVRDEGDITYIVVIDVELGTSTFTVWEVKIN